MLCSNARVEVLVISFLPTLAYSAEFITPVSKSTGEPATLMEYSIPDRWMPAAESLQFMQIGIYINEGASILSLNFLLR